MGHLIKLVIGQTVPPPSVNEVEGTVAWVDSLSRQEQMADTVVSCQHSHYLMHRNVHNERRNTS